MNAIVKKIQHTLEHGRPEESKHGLLASQVLKEILKETHKEKR